MRDPFPYLARESFDESFDEFWIVMQTFFQSVLTAHCCGPAGATAYTAVPPRRQTRDLATGGEA